MTHKTHDLCVKTGTYTDARGDEKGRWMNVGALMEGENGPFVMLNAAFNPAGIQREEGRDSILISCFEPQQDAQPDRRPEPPQPQGRGKPDRSNGYGNRER